jgi:hypothetical protein
MVEKELIVSLSELTRAEIVCSDPECCGSVTLDLNRQVEESSKCPNCRKPVITPMISIVEAWRNFVTKVGHGQIQFRIKQ